jgi:hypothetical protein
MGTAYKPARCYGGIAVHALPDGSHVALCGQRSMARNGTVQPWVVWRHVGITCTKCRRELKKKGVA